MPSKAKFSKSTKRDIWERDGMQCIFCSNPPVDIHHVFFGQEANYSKNRNNTDQGVTLCRTCHNKAHSCSRGEGIRQKAIDYLIK